MNIPILSTTNVARAQQDIEMQPMKSLSVCEVVHEPADCCPQKISKHVFCCAQCIPKVMAEKWRSFRCVIYRLVEHRSFEWFIIISIFVSSTTLVS